MEVSQLKIDGDCYQDKEMLAKFSRDMSDYRILPALVVAPRNEADIVKTLDFARSRGLGVVSRSGGSGLSGAAVGPGIVLNLKKYMTRIIEMGEHAVVQPGVILADFVRRAEAHDRMLPAIPSSSPICALGGNVATRATGPKTAKYGTMDAFVTSLRFVSARGEVVDTSQRLPDYLDAGPRRLRRRFLADKASRAIVRRRPFIAGGYNLKALEQYNDPAQQAVHLLVGSVGTLGIVTEIRLGLIRRRPTRGTLVAHFRDDRELGDAVLRLKALAPTALEFSDAACSGRVNGKILNLQDPETTGTLAAEFDDSSEKVQEGSEILKAYDISRLWQISAGSPEEEALWRERRQILPTLMKYCRENRLLLPSIIDDVAIHLKDFGAVISDLKDLMRRLGVEVSFYGHAGFGSIHARPVFDPTRGDLKEKITTVSRETFKVLRKYSGTLVGEHNAGRSRSAYLKEELGSAYAYLQDIKKLFDPGDLLNPGVLFNTAPLTDLMDLTVRSSGPGRA